MKEAIKRFITIFILLICDVLILFLLVYLSIIIRTKILPSFISNLPVFDHPLERYLWFIVIQLGIMAYEGAYTKRLTFWDEVRLLWKSTTLTGIVGLIILFVTKQTESYSRIVVLTWLSLCFIILPVFRTRIKEVLHKLGWGKEKVLILGATENGIKFMKAIKAEPNLGYEVVGVIDDTTDLQEIEGIKVFRYEDDAERYINHPGIRTIAISDPNKSFQKFANLLNKTHASTRNIFYIPNVKQIPVIGTEIRYFFQEDIFALELKNNLANTFNYFLKRTMDYLLSLALLPLVIPILIIISLLIKITSKGPVIFSQERVGKGGKVFRCYKFRTMYVDAEKKLKQLLEKDSEAKAEWEKKYKLSNDPRVTPFGKFLRKTSLDELPQLFNVLKGEMSLIGPRPVTKEEIERYYKENAELYYLIPPGITGLWQVSGRSNLTYEERVSLDCWYVRNWSLWLDLIILLRTIKVVLKGEGAC